MRSTGGSRFKLRMIRSLSQGRMEYRVGGELFFRKCEAYAEQRDANDVTPREQGHAILVGTSAADANRGRWLHHYPL